MLGKLLKYEFKNTYKVMLAVYAAYVLLTIVGSGSTYSMAKGYSDANVFTVSMIVFYVLSSVAHYIATFVYICIRYFKTMYSSQGYLTHTLPVKGVSIFNAKLIVSTVWMISSCLLLLVSIFFFGNSASQGEFWNAITTYSWSELNERMYEEIGVYMSQLIGWSIVGIILGMLTINLWIFTSFALGQLSDKHKVAVSVGAGMGIYFGSQILGISGVASTLRTISVNNNYSIDNSNFAEFFNSTTTSSFIEAAGFCVVMYLVCVLINKEKLNLE